MALFLLLWLWPRIGTGQEGTGGPPNPPAKFVRLGDRLHRAVSEPAPSTPAKDESEDTEAIDEAWPEGAIADDGDEFVVTPHDAGNCLGSCCEALRRNLEGVWVRGEFLVGWVDGFYSPALVTTSPLGTSFDVAGELGQPTTNVLFGNADSSTGAYPGGRIRLGYWFDPCDTYGIEAGFFGLSQKSSVFYVDSSAVPILARPIFNVEPELVGQDAEMVAFPGLLDGRIQVSSQTQLQGVEVLYRQALIQACTRRVDWLAGYRYLGLDEQLVISDFKRFFGTGTGLQLGTTIEEFDRFATQNDFHGGELGVIAELRHNYWTLEVLGKLAIGNNRSQVTINGATTVTVPDPDVATTPYGLLALPSNSGSRARDTFTVIPELGITLGYDLTPRLRATVGYMLLYWSQVARPGDQIDLDVNLSQIQPDGLIGPTRPEFNWVGSDVWVQGLSVGLNYRF